MKEALTIDSLLRSAQTTAVKSELLPSVSTGSEDAVSESFLKMLQKTIDSQSAVVKDTAGEYAEVTPEGELNPDPAVNKITAMESSEEARQNPLENQSEKSGKTVSDKEILASSVIAAAAMPKNLARFNEFLKEFAVKNPDKIGHLNEIVGSLREALVTGVITLDQAVGKLKNAADDFLSIFASLRNLNIGDLKSPLESSRMSENNAGLTEEAVKLKDKFMENFQEMFELSNYSGEVWISQVWPINQAASIFNGGGDRRVPYDPDRRSSDSALPDKEIQQWDDKFESEWSRAAKSVAADNHSSKSAAQNLNSLADFPAAVAPADESVPGGEDLFGNIAKVIQLNLDNQNQRISLELHPDILGEMKMKLSLDKDTLTARMIVQNDSIRSLLTERMDELKNALQQKGVALGKVEIAVFDKLSDDLLALNQSIERNFNLNPGAALDFMRTPYSQSVAIAPSSAWVV